MQRGHFIILKNNKIKEIFSPNNSNEKELLRIYLKEIIKKKGKI